MNAPSRRPRVICHMIATIDGRIVTEHWPDIGEGRREYERTASTYAADAWMCGRVTMEHFAGSVRGDAELEGGGRINGAMLHAGLVDEVSLLVAPIVDGTLGTGSLFDIECAPGGHRGRRLALVAVEHRAEGVLWIRYHVEETAPGSPAQG